MQNFSFPVDPVFAHQHNELLRDSRRLRNSGITMGLSFLAGGLVLPFLVEGSGLLTSTAVILGLGSATTGVIAARQVGTAQQLYDRYPLAPAIIAEVNARDMVLLALVNTNVVPHQPPRWGLAVRTITSIPGLTTRTLGTRIPVAAVSGQLLRGNKDHWQQITPMPLAWATPDEDTILAAHQAIPAEEWHLLENSLDRLTEVKSTKHNLLVL